MKNENSCTQDNIEYILQGVELIRRLDDDLYCNTAPPFNRGGVGRHFRHILDHYVSFEEGVSHRSGTGPRRIDYDRRGRDERTEVDRHHAIDRFLEIVGFLRALAHESTDERVIVKMDTGCDAVFWGGSSVMRELQFLLSHTVHHYALIQLMLRVLGFEPGGDFGVAPSTLKHERNSKPARAAAVSTSTHAGKSA